MKRSPAEREALARKLAEVINYESAEGRSNTPDFILGAFLVSALEAFEEASVARENWYGGHLAPGRSEAWHRAHPAR